MTETVYIEYCVSCKDHAWCTSHDESKYAAYFESCTKAILKSFTDIKVAPNEKPMHMRPKTRIFLRPEPFPRLGAFEVFFRGELLFSKLETGLWPNPISIVHKIEDRKGRRACRSTHSSRKVLKRPAFVSPVQGSNIRRSHTGVSANKRLADRPLARKPPKPSNKKLPGLKPSNKKPATREEGTQVAQESLNSDQVFGLPSGFLSDRNLLPITSIEMDRVSPELFSDRIQFTDKYRRISIETDQGVGIVNKPANVNMHDKRPENHSYESNDKVEQGASAQQEVENSAKVEAKLAPKEKEISYKKQNLGSYLNQFSDQTANLAENQHFESRKLDTAAERFSVNTENLCSDETAVKNQEVLATDKISNEKIEEDLKEPVHRPEFHTENIPKIQSQCESIQKQELVEHQMQLPADRLEYSSEKFNSQNETGKSEPKVNLQKNIVEKQHVGNTESQSSPSKSETQPALENALNDRNLLAVPSSQPNKKEPASKCPEDLEEEIPEDKHFIDESQEVRDLLDKREITKKYEISVDCNSVTNKKITYHNTQDVECVFQLYTTSKFMVILDNPVKIAARKKYPFKFKFDPVGYPHTAQYYLFIDLEGKPWETIELIVNYE